ncbi:DUF3575 domain-containing protein [Dysgonomonas sp. HDW5A]|uniref:DUF3575 domain-containing protein n=1 Tax=Dysgonomonas sp. HDW5A TaxID=2714926 RepID=UPI001409740A|nr:DUF3575 domain-containing protein [Dysgonomonas sp. HDW5A]QIK60147.1 DUF3575 domain-containing protein [Dysgonomonas sp. HDW5A]
MKRFLQHILVCLALCFFYCPSSQAQALKTNIPLILTGTPNIGVEWSVGKQLTVNGDILWAPYLFKKDEEVFRSLIGSVDVRYYINPKYYYTNDLWDGFYVGPYAMYGNFNIGLKNSDEDKTSYRRKGWGVSAGLSTGYKFYLSSRFRLEVNLGLGYAHMQYDKHELGGEFAHYPIERKKTKAYIGPTKFGVHLVYNIFR